MAIDFKRPTRLVSVCTDGELVSEYEAVQAELESARRVAIADSRLNSPVKKLELRSAELYKAQEESSVTFKLRGLQRAVWDELKTAHPQRKDNESDANLGYNVDTCLDAAMVIEGTIVEATQNGEPIENAIEEWKALSPELTDGQWELFQLALSGLNGGRPQVPFSQSGYKLMQGSAEKSK